MFLICGSFPCIHPETKNDKVSPFLNTWILRSLWVCLVRRPGKHRKNKTKSWEIFTARCRKDAPSAHIPLAGTQSMATLYCEKSGNGSTLCLGGREFRVVMSAKFRKPLKCGKLHWVMFLQSRGKWGAIMFQKPPFILLRMSLDIIVSPSCSPSSPQH